MGLTVSAYLEFRDSSQQWNYLKEIPFSRNLESLEIVLDHMEAIKRSFWNYVHEKYQSVVSYRKLPLDISSQIRDISNDFESYAYTTYITIEDLDFYNWDTYYIEKLDWSSPDITKRIGLYVLSLDYIYTPRQKLDKSHEEAFSTLRELVETYGNSNVRLIFC